MANLDTKPPTAKKKAKSGEGSILDADVKGTKEDVRSLYCPSG